MENNYSNCINSRVRRFEAYCKLKQEVKPMTFVCDEYGKGTQTELINSEGKVIWPVKKNI
jgi:hypothetical protein